MKHIKITLLLVLGVLTFSTLYAEKVCVTFVGDVMLGHRYEPVLDKNGSDFPFKKIQFFLDKSDILFGNLENPVSKRGTPVDKQYTFRMNPDHLSALTSAGFDVVCLANNHVLDYGREALSDTFSYLEQANILYCGAGENLMKAREPAVVSVKGQTLAFLAYSFTLPEDFYATKGKAGTAPANSDFFRKDIKKARQKYDWVIVSFHWGKEYTPVPHDRQIFLAHTAVDAGADAVIGHHPHAVQSFEIYKKKLIAYSLGNFVFGTGSHRPSGAVLKLGFSSDRSMTADIFPVVVNNYKSNFQVQLMTGKPLQKALTHIKNISSQLIKQKKHLPLRIEKDRLTWP